jgi:hypothetical protein
MAVEIGVFGQNPRMPGQAGRQHVRENARHDSRAQHIVEALQSFADQVGIYVVEKVVNVLHCRVKIPDAKLVRKRSHRIEACLVDNVSVDRHLTSVLWAQRRPTVAFYTPSLYQHNERGIE